MSVASKRRHVIKKIQMELVLPSEGQMIAQVLSSCGNNLLEVEDENSEKYLVSMPSKFRKCIWVKRGQFVVIVPIKEGDRVRAEVEHILDEENILYIREHKQWPDKFEEHALKMTREAKRNTKDSNLESHCGIDADMLPPSDDDDEEYNSEDEEEYYSEEDNEYNPNRSAAPR
ncbi:Probable RNA-binding protein EIF1AD [Strongyloides ratti]|uniref:Probable RNA-binding protein EIF1AD n=1 Tax=Strongyloides ratti TaxID=34506 RepID=A0A090MUX0_STRRB|nr:Probable RNA-binding protein EIF1AD [Strongyloides ratti]CEF62493.1 Probable RNA-binding protein EIF1AD [Strongyloides ratti]